MTLLLAFVFACGSPAPVNVRAYADAARETPSDPARAALDCAKVDGDAGGECMAWAADSMAKHDPDAGAAICAKITLSTWKDECGFLVAEETLQQQGAEAASKRCANAGTFSDNCLMHVWKHHASELLARKPFADAATGFAGAIGWSDGVITRDAALDDRFWDLFFDAAFGAPEGTADAPKVDRPPMDVAWSETLAGDLGKRCKRAVPASLQRALNRADRRPANVPGALDVTALCASDATPLVDRVYAGAGVRYVPSPLLDEVSTRFITRRCAASPDAPSAPRSP